MGKEKNKKRKSRKGLDLLNTPERTSIDTGARSPEITVLTPTYNRPAYLRETISSVVNQVMTDWEMMVINDGGQDVRETVEDFNDDRIRYFNRKKNRGKAACLNFALRKARGAYIAYIDDDDIWYPNHLKALSTALDENPDIGAVYSDLYAVRFIKDKKNGKRYPLDKWIQVCRDYNRDFMFYFNHTLHVSLMHRKDLAFRAGGYDENITVLIDWNITRKLSFYTDFKYIPVVTGEYYMAITQSDRISNLEREDNEKFKHNLRKIKADLPPEPWPKADRMAVIFPVNEWTDSVVEIITGLIDNLSYPVRFIIVNNDMEKEEAGCREALGKIGELKNIFVHTPAKALTDLEAYRFGAERVEVDYVYLVSGNVDTKIPYRLIAARGFLKEGKCEGVKWDAEKEKEGTFDVVMKKEHFLQASNPAKPKQTKGALINPGFVPPSLQFDYLLHQSKRQHESGNYKLAYSYFKKAEAVKSGGSGGPYLIDIYSRICFDLKRYDEAEEACRALIERGYGADNWIRLGKILQIKEKYNDAIEAYKKGIEGIDLKESDLDSKVFPIAVPVDFGSFTALIGMGECMLETGNLAEAARMFRRAAKTKANSHRPLLGFGKLFLKTNELNRAEEALVGVIKRNGKDPEAYGLLGVLREKQKKIDIAYNCYLKAFQQDKTDPKNIDHIYHVGSTLKKWEEIKGIFEDFLGHRPGHVPAISRLASIYYRLGEHRKAEDLVEKGLAFDEGNSELKDIYSKIQQAKC